MFNGKCAIIGMIHTLPLPGSAGYKGNMQAIVERAVEEAVLYKREGVDAVLVENMHDAPYLCGYVDAETIAAAAVVCQTVKRESGLEMGIQLLAAANMEALGVAVACGLEFMRVEGFVYAHVGDEGIHESCAAKLIRKRASLKAEHIQIFADIKKKHSAHAITQDVSLIETARAAEFFGADGVIVTGISTASPAEISEVQAARTAVANKVLVGSGITPENVRKYVSHCDGIIVGSTLKHDGSWKNPVDVERVRRLVSQVKG